MALSAETQTVLSSEKTLSSLLSSMRSRAGTQSSATQGGFASLLAETGVSDVSSRSARDARPVREDEEPASQQTVTDSSSDDTREQSKTARTTADETVRETKPSKAEASDEDKASDETDLSARDEAPAEDATQDAASSDTVAEEGVAASGKKKAKVNDDEALEANVAAFIPLDGCPTPPVVSGDATEGDGAPQATTSATKTTPTQQTTTPEATAQAASPDLLVSPTKKKDTASSGGAEQTQAQGDETLTSALDKIAGELAAAQKPTEKAESDTADTTDVDEMLAGLDLDALAQKVANDKVAAVKEAKADAPVRSTLGQSGQETAFAQQTTQNTAAAGAAAAVTTTASSSGTQESGSTSAANSSIGLASGVRSAISYGTASELSAARVTKGGTTGLPQAVEQVAVQLHKAAKDGTDTITIQLRPGELGKIEVKLEFGADKSVTGTVMADNQTTLNMLQKDEGSLQRALQEAGLQADSGCLEFSLRGDGGQSAFAQSQSDSSSYTSSSNRTTMQVSDTQTGETTTGVDSTYYLTPGRVNIHV